MAPNPKKLKGLVAPMVPCKFMPPGDPHGPKPCEFIKFGNLHGRKPYTLKIYKVW